MRRGISPPESIDDLIAAGQKVFADDREAQLQVAFDVSQALTQRGAKASPKLTEWAGKLVTEEFKRRGEDASAWAFHPLPKSQGNQWGVAARPSADGDAQAAFLDSHVATEDAMGELRSAVFAAPKQLEFYIAGHRGFPNLPAHEKNFVRLIDAQTNQKIAEAFPPRNDVAVKVTWDLAGVAGKRVYLSVVDGDDEDAYAWLAAGRFSPAVVKIPAKSPKAVAERLQMGVQLASNLELAQALPAILEMLADPSLEGGVAMAAGNAAARLGKVSAPSFATLLDASASTPDLRARGARADHGQVEGRAGRDLFGGDEDADAAGTGSAGDGAFGHARRGGDAAGDDRGWESACGVTSTGGGAATAYRVTGRRCGGAGEGCSRLLCRRGRIWCSRWSRSGGSILPRAAGMR